MRKPKQIPRLMRSELLGIIYIVTKYDDLGDGMFLANEKFDITKEFECMATQWYEDGD